MAFRWIGQSPDGSTVTLKRLEGCPIQVPAYFTPEWRAANEKLIDVGAVVDVETTGLNHNQDVVIEVGLRQFEFHRQTGEILGLLKSYGQFQDPGRPIPSEIAELTGITDEMVAGQQIDWAEVNQLVAESSLVIAHNARFDRPFIDRSSQASGQSVWACTFQQIDWSAKGYTSGKLELLNIYHGFFTNSHRAINDVDALLYLLSLPDEHSGRPYLAELVKNAHSPRTKVMAVAAPFEAKDRLKGRGYSWDNTNRFWAKILGKDQIAAETLWLEEHVYAGKYRGVTSDIALTDGFKS